MGTIVVGFDGSPHARAALEYAAREALSHGADLRVVSVWHVPTMAYAAGIGPAPGFDPHELEEAARQTASHALEQMGRDATRLTVETRVREGHPAHVLVEEAAEADLLVLGSRGLGGFRGLLLGSVSQQCAAHARCPVVIVHARTER